MMRPANPTTGVSRGLLGALMLALSALVARGLPL
jgi:hypothetical protein